MDSSLVPFLKPLGVVVIGASTSPEKLGYGVARNLISSGFPGGIHLIGQKSGELFDHQIITNLQDIPDPVDLAILIVPPNATPQAIEACGRRGIHTAVIVSSGFREIGGEGAALEHQCVEIARKHRVRLLGPNCIGIIDTHVPLDTTFLQSPMPAPGGIGFISHSGAFCASIVDWSRGQGFGFSQIISLGNQADVNETDMLPFLVADPHTRVIVLYLEGISHGIQFIQSARELAKHKPIIAMKVGRFEAGQKAAASHTGALAASDFAFDAAFAKAGILRANSAEQLFDWAQALDYCPLPRGKRIAILTNAGGPGVIAADALEVNGLALAQFSEGTLQNLRATLPSAASVENPVDMLASASPATYAVCLEALLDEIRVDGVMVILPPPPMYKAEDMAKEIIKIVGEYDKPVVIALLGSMLIENARTAFRQARIPVFPFPERAASAMGALACRADLLDEMRAAIETVAPVVADLNTRDSSRLLSAYGISNAPVRLARNPDECASISRDLGFPVVLKIASMEMSHKSDVGGVILDITDEEQARLGYTNLLDRIGKSHPSVEIEGIYIQPQISGGQEVIVGAVRDPNFGPLMMFGSGGVEVEGLKDVTFALAPLTPQEARKMIRQTWAGRKLAGFRSLPPADMESVIDVLVKLSLLIHDHPEIEEIEINPLKVLATGSVALDVRLQFGRPE